jgi:hypothetical protein
MEQVFDWIVVVGTAVGILGLGLGMLLVLLGTGRPRD